jgi:hypothetical protein
MNYMLLYDQLDDSLVFINVRYAAAHTKVIIIYVMCANKTYVG